MLPNVFICTLIMWGLSAIAVVPLSKKLFANAVAENPELASVANSASIGNEMQTRLDRLYNIKFIQADVLVMGIAGFIAGLTGIPLIGFAWKAKAWPGFLALMGTSFLFYYITSQTKV